MFLGKLLAEEVEEVLVLVEVLVVELDVVELDALVVELEVEEVLAGRHWLYQGLE